MIWLSTLALAMVMGTSEPDVCHEVDEAMLSMSLEDFDQRDHGWRSLNADGCDAVTADGIKRYRERNAETLKDPHTLVWHEAQLRATAGQTAQAIELMLQTRETDTAPIRPYTDASIAFLRRDRAGLLAARAALIAMPEPDYFRKAADRYAVSYPGLPPLAWPLNLDVVDGLIACFDKPYAVAYDCR